MFFRLIIITDKYPEKINFRIITLIINEKYYGNNGHF